MIKVKNIEEKVFVNIVEENLIFLKSVVYAAKKRTISLISLNAVCFYQKYNSPQKKWAVVLLQPIFIYLIKKSFFVHIFKQILNAAI